MGYFLRVILHALSIGLSSGEYGGRKTRTKSAPRKPTFSRVDADIIWVDIPLETTYVLYCYVFESEPHPLTKAVYLDSSSIDRIFFKLLLL